MNIIFLTLVRIADIEERHIYNDLMRKFRDEGHQVYIVTAAERRLGQETSLVDSHGVKILNVKMYQTPITWTKKSKWLSYSRIINWG